MADEDQNYLVFVRWQPCAAAALGRCAGGIEAHHDRDLTGLALRSHDHRAIPLCKRHHADVDQAARGVFSGWPRERRREFFECAIAETRAAYADWQAFDEF